MHEAELLSAQRPEEAVQTLQDDRILIELRDIDTLVTGRPIIKIGAKKTSGLAHIARWLKWKFSTHEDAIKSSPNDQIEFFHKQGRLSGDEIPQGASMLWYRVLDPLDDGLIKVAWDSAYKNKSLSRSQLDAIARDVESGATVGELRRKVASTLSTWTSVVEPEQVIIEAVGGFRQGPLEGDNWECKKVAGWLCRHLTIGIAEPRDFYAFYGFNEKYIIHIPRLSREEAVCAYTIKQWLRSEILRAVSQTTDRLDEVRRKDITLYYNGQPVRDGSLFVAGESFHFELSRDAEDKFLRLEAWLLPLTETCNICADEKRVSEMPVLGRITGGCQHDATTCKDCVSQWITSSMETLAWDRLKCPECPEPLGFNDVIRYATKDVFDRYERQATRAALGKIKGFRWCLNPKCDAGEIFPSHCQKAKCHACSKAICIHHDVPWHYGETCREYDKRTRDQQKDNELSEKKIKEIAKPCPGCRKKIHKHSGCDHITCVCGHEWCWLCSAPYTKDADAFLHCEHTRECRYFHSPPFWEGRDALLPFLAHHARAGGRRRPPGHVRWVEMGGVIQEPAVDAAEAAAEGNRAAPPNPIDIPERRPRNLAANNLFDFLIDNFPRENRDRRRNDQNPFIDEALLFQFAEVMERAIR
ncbi:hypothetical protein NPX13_g4140 [Xylaria arbuscula]|uniref:RBR-type E3 ubiquitin transferase n=1 Tax=Xylaria arbuscula TaxID=114810 RepID=A0A9W8NGW4_9PEZI|nr:hypothetical protein NPX13_g4140 [Xylaria arbuscula]